MEFTAKQIAELLQGELEGNENARVNRLAKIEEGEPGSLSFLANPKYTPHIYNTAASVVIVGKDFEAEQEVGSTLIRVDDAYGSFAKLLEIYNQMKYDRQGISDRSVIADSAVIGKGVYIGPNCTVGENVKIGDGVKIYPGSQIENNVTIGDRCLIHQGVMIYADCEIARDCIIHAGVIIGADGFGFAPKGAGYDKVAQIGNVIIEEGVEIGANTCIDRATLGHTILRKGVKLDNLVQVAHNVEIGESTVIAAQTGIAGSTKIGKNCMIGGQVGIIGHLNIGDNVKIAAQSGIAGDIKDDAIVQGSPAFEIGDYKRAYVYFRKLTEMAQDIKDLKTAAKRDQ